ncbi:MAG: glycosyltransferase family 4 protein [Salinibacter sp.]|uniref:glycosyltransferase family 4 protein n=1 Tax=Salinibacter sp. TaxID=2065818 RepID=UPI0035D44BEA
MYPDSSSILFLCTDAYGTGGGIAKFNRDLCRALTTEPLSAQITALPRVAPSESIGEIPSPVDYRVEAADSTLHYLWEVLRLTFGNPHTEYDGIICGHMNLLPVAALVAQIRRLPLLVILHGVDAWKLHLPTVAMPSLYAIDSFVSVSQYTKDRFLEWAPLTDEQGHVIPNCIDTSLYGPGPKQNDLLGRYGLKDRTVLLTLGRLSSAEQYKGHDEVLEVLPDLSDEVPDIAYLVCGDGDDRPRLKAKAKRLGVEDRTVFAGYVPEDEKADHYRLADAFVMPGRGEGFGIVYFEALACGVPVVASMADASQEAVRNGELGTVVDPDDPDNIKAGILDALREPQGVPDGLDYFSVDRFRKRWHRVVDDCFRTSTTGASAAP